MLDGCPNGHDAAEKTVGSDGVAYCRACKRERVAAWRALMPEERRDAHRAYMRAYQQRRARQLRLDVLDAYGHACACCGEVTAEFLSVDHINNDGAAHRKVIGEGSVRLYTWLKKNGWPTDNFQLLCGNCHRAKSYYGECPHVGR